MKIYLIGFMGCGKSTIGDELADLLGFVFIDLDEHIIEQQRRSIVEIFEEDGVLVFSLEHFMPGFLETKKYYHIGLHEYAKVFILSYPNKKYPDFGKDFWNKIEKINGLKREALEGFMGLKNIETLPIGIVYHFVFPEEFATVFPEESGRLKEIFG